MGAKFEMGRIAGLPIVIDISFLITMVLFFQGYFTSGNSTLMSIGFLLAVGLAISILIHEFAHAVAGHNLGVSPSHVELNGLGGLCYWAGPLPQAAWRRIVIYLVGPLSNFVLYLLFTALADMSVIHANPYVFRIVSSLAWVNGWMAVFNLLPAFPLDGGRALDAFLGQFVTFKTARTVVGVLGLCLAGYCAYLGVMGDTWMFVLALLLGLDNYNAVQDASNPPWQRRN